MQTFTQGYSNQVFQWDQWEKLSKIFLGFKDLLTHWKMIKWKDSLDKALVQWLTSNHSLIREPNLLSVSENARI